MLGNVVPGKLIKCQATAAILKIFQMSQRINYFLYFQHYPGISYTYYLLLFKMLLFMGSKDHSTDKKMCFLKYCLLIGFADTSYLSFFCIFFLIFSICCLPDDK